MPKNESHYAILVAINRYPGLSNLHGPENDASAFRAWLLDEGGGNLDERNVAVIRSSDFPPVTEPEIPDDANPSETQFKKTLNRWCKPNGDWLEKVGERLYLFFAGHGFTAGTGSDPALFTAQAQLAGDTAHIAGLRYALKIQNAGFFNEIVLVMDCCQDVLKAAGVNEPTWSPPDRQLSGTVKLMKAFGAPRGRKAFETEASVGIAHGYFSSVFIESLRKANSDAEGYVTARAVEETFSDLWGSRYAALTGYTPPFDSPRDMKLYLRKMPESWGVPADESDWDPLLYFRGIDVLVEAHLMNVRIRAPHEQGAQIRLLDSGRRKIADGIGELRVAIPVGEYTARFRVGDAVEDRIFRVDVGDQAVDIQPRRLAFSSPIPMENTSTYHEYHSSPAIKLARAATFGFLHGPAGGGGILTVFARDSAHKEFDQWLMPPEICYGLRLRKLNAETSEPVKLDHEVLVDRQRGFVTLSLSDVAPGTYLLGVRRLQRDHWYWQEMVITVGQPMWRTEAYLDSIDDDWTGRRFDIHAASVLIRPYFHSGYGSMARATEVARLAMTEGRLGLDAEGIERLMNMECPEPILALYTAYALTLLRLPDVHTVYRICKKLYDQWTSRSADVKLLLTWCSRRDSQLEFLPEFELRPDEMPMMARGWELIKQLGPEVQLRLGAQYHVAMWRVAGSVWTQTFVSELAIDAPLVEERSNLFALFPRRENGAIDYPRVASALARPLPTSSPLHHSLRRAMLNAIESGDPKDFQAVIDQVAGSTGLDSRIVLMALKELVLPGRTTRSKLAIRATAG